MNTTHHIHIVGILAVTVTAALSGCAQGGVGRANGGIAIGGSATNVVSVAPSVSFGDAVAKAASDVAQAYLKFSLPTGAAASTVDAAKKAAVTRGVEAGARVAQNTGQPLTDAAKADLQKALEAAVNKALTTPK